MMKKILGLSVYLLIIAGNGLFAQGISCPAVIAGPDTTLACSTCVTLEAEPVSGFETTDYTVGQIPYNPFPYSGGTQILLNIDDTWSASLPMGFDFCFYGSSYNSLVIGSNGLISFDITQAGNYCQWPINTAIPSNQNPMNSIMAPFHDIDPSVTGQVRWAQYGTAPCRLFVISWDACAMFSCNTQFSTQQIVLYETTNVIETYIQNKPLCTGWNSGASIHGIQNATGTQAVVVPGRNFPTTWTATNDAWAFVPNGASNYAISWFESGQAVPFANTDTVTVCPSGATDYIAVTTYYNCNGDSVVVSDTAVIDMCCTPIALTETHNDVTCFGASDGSATVVANSGVGVFTFLWVPTGGNAATATGLGPGTYTCVVEDTSGCSSGIQVVILEPAELQASLVSTNVSCFGLDDGTILVNATGGDGSYTYSWTPNVSSTSSAVNLPFGAYSIVVSDGNLCDDTISVTITQPPAISISTTTVAVTCANSADGTATATATGGTGPFTYLWLPSLQGTATATGLTGGSHTVVATDSTGCPDTTTVTVSSPPAIVITVSSTDVTCNGGADGTATAVATGGTGTLNYQWFPIGGTAATATGLIAGTYFVIVTDINLCADTATVIVEEPPVLTATLTSTDETCWMTCDGIVTASPNGGTSPFTYLWDTPNNDVTPTVQGLCNGWYNVTVTDGNGCIATDSVEVGFPPAPIADAGPDMSFCEGENGVQLDGTASGGGGAPYYYTWTCSPGPCGFSSPNAADPIVIPTDTSTYYLVVTDQNGCTSLVDSVTVNVMPKPIVDAGPDVVICGDPASPGVVLNPTVDGFGPYVYDWSPGLGLSDSTIATPFARPDTTTIYTLVVTDLATGCTSAATTVDTNATITVVVDPQPIADAGIDRAICLGDTTILQGTGTGAGPSYSFQWSPTTGLSDPAIPNPFASPTLTTEYILTVISNGCPSYGDTVRVTVNPIPTVDAGPDRDYCWGGSAQLDGVVDSLTWTPAMQYFWSPGLTLSDSTIEDPIAFPDVTTEYYFWVESSEGCVSSMDSVTITIRPTPQVDAGPPTTWCAADSTLQLNGTLNWANNAPPGDVQNTIIDWAPDGWILGADNVLDPIVAPDSSMWFYFTATYDSCTHTDSVLISVIPEIGAMAGADTTIACQYDSVQFTSSGGIGGASFQWIPAAGLSDPNIANPLAAPDSSTTYLVIIEEGGCVDTAAVTLDVIPLPEVAFINSQVEGCVAHEVSFTSVSTDAVNVIWNWGDGTLVQNEESILHTFEDVGVFNVTLYGVNVGGCMDSSMVMVTVHDTISADFTSDPLYPVEMFIPGAEVDFTDLTLEAVEWTWDFGNGTGSNEQNPNTSYTQPGNYMVSLVVTNEFGCVSEIIHGPYIVNLPDLFIPNVFSPNEDGVNDMYLVDYDGNQPFSMSIFDRWGVEVFQSKNKIEPWDGNVAAAKAPEGTYFYSLRIGNREFTGPISLVR